MAAERLCWIPGHGYTETWMHDDYMGRFEQHVAEADRGLDDLIERVVVKNERCEAILERIEAHEVAERAIIERLMTLDDDQLLRDPDFTLIRAMRMNARAFELALVQALENAAYSALFNHRGSDDGLPQRSN